MTTLAIGALAASVGLNTSLAAENYWTGGTGSYNVSANWSSNSVPAEGDVAINDNGTNHVVQVNAGDPDWTLSEIRAGNSAGGAFEQNGQAVNLDGPARALRLGVAADSTGVFTLNEGTLNYNSGELTIGELGTGIMNVNGGSVTGSGNLAVNRGTSLFVTASMDGGKSASGYTWFEQGYYTGDATIGVPAAGTTFTSVSEPDHSYVTAPSYATNDVFMINATDTNATMTFKTPTAFSALSFVGSAGHGPMTVNYTIHHADDSTETGSFDVLDWYADGTLALGVGGRVSADGLGFQISGAGGTSTPYLLSTDVTVANTTSPITSVDLAYTSGNGAACLFGVSGSSGGDFTPVSVTGFNEDVIVEASAAAVLSQSVTDTLNQTGGTIEVTDGGQFFVGNYGSGVYNLSGGTNTVHNYIAFGRSGGSGTVNMTGGVLNQAGGGNLLVGTGYQAPSDGSAVGVLNQSGGTIHCEGQFLCPENSPSTGTYNLSGTGALIVNNWVAIGRGGATGVLNMTNGSITKTGDGGNHMIIGAGGPGTLNQFGGAITNATSDFWLAESADATWNMNGGSALLDVLHICQNSGVNGTLNLNGGDLTVREITTGNSGGASSLYFDGGVLHASADNTNFLHDLTGAYVQTNGAIFDTAGHDITIAQALYDAGSGGGVEKDGEGTLTFLGYNSYVGPTVVNAGSVVMPSGAYLSDDVTVASGASFGVINQFLNGQLFLQNATFAGADGSSFDFDLGAFGNPTTAPVVLYGNLAVNGDVTVNIADQVPAIGTVPLIQYASLSGSGRLTIGDLPIGVEAHLSTNSASSTIELVITASAGTPRWDGQVNGDWDIDQTANWVELSDLTSTTYKEGNPVLFDDNATGTTDINVVDNVHPGTMTFANTNLSYTLGGTNKISGSTGLTKRGPGALTIQNAALNDYTGANVIEGGTLNVTNLANGGSPSAIGASAANPANLVLGDATLAYSGPAVAINRGYTIQGTATIDAESNLGFGGKVVANKNSRSVKSGPGQLAYSAAGTNQFSLTPPGQPGYSVVDGTVVLDGSAGGQVNNVDGEMWVGDTPDAGASLILTNTTLNVGSWFAVGRGNGTAGNTSSAVLYDSHLNAANLSFGYDNGIAGNLASQVLSLNGDSVVTNRGDQNLAESTGSSISVNVGGTSLLWSQNRFFLGRSTGTTGRLEVAESGRVVVNNGWFSIANGDDSFGSAVINDNGSVSVSGDLNVTDVGAGTASLTAQDDAQIHANNLFVAKGNNSTGTFTITNNAKFVSGNGITIASGDGSTGTVNLAGGSLAVNLVQSTPGAGTFNFNGGTLIAKNPFAANFMFNLDAINVMSGGATIDSDTNDISIAQPLLDAGGNGGLTKIGSGTLRLNGTNTYTGTTLVSEGTLGGKGSIASPLNVSSGATLAPGSNGIGTFTVNNDVTLAGDTKVEISAEGSKSSDVVNVTGDLTYGGTLTVSNIGTNALSVGDTFQIFTGFASETGSITVKGSPGAGLGYSFDPATGVLSVIESVEQPVLNATVGSAGITFNWSGAYKLVSQTNSLDTGLGTNWYPVPNGTNGVTVPVGKDSPAVFFGLQPTQ